MISTRKVYHAKEEQRKTVRGERYGKNKMIHHYITKYEDNGKLYAEAWIRMNLFGKHFCFSKRKIDIDDFHTVTVTDEEDNLIIRLFRDGAEINGIAKDGYRVSIEKGSDEPI